MNAPDDDGPEAALATAADIDAIVALLEANETTRGGSITGHFERARLAAAIADMPVIVARWRGRLIGVLVSASMAAVRQDPVIRRMLEAYPGGADAYVYGPICIDARHRGEGLATALFERLKRELPGREGVLFIRRDNPASLRAHARLGMQSRGCFTADGVEYEVLSYRG